MTKDFAKGNSFKDVAFDEYVLINNPNTNHPDNGKIFRRGYDYNSDRMLNSIGILYKKVDNNWVKYEVDELTEEKYTNLSSESDKFIIESVQAKGAEYIGCIIGPAGKAPLLSIGSYEWAYNKNADAGLETRKGQGLYSPNGDNPGLIPGKDGNEYNDSIKWAYASIRNDNFGDDTQAFIGFKFPYLVTQMSVQSVSPYAPEDNYKEREVSEGDYTDTSNIDREDDLTHPYYNKWHLEIPKGVKGDTFKNLKVTTFNTYFNDSISNSDSHNRNLYDVNGNILLGEENSEIKDNLTFFVDKYEEIIGEILVPSNNGYDYITGKDRNSLLRLLSNKEILVYEKWNYDDKQTGQVTYYYLGDYNQVDNMTLEDGIFTITFTHDDSKTFTLDYIKDIKIDETGKVTLVHSTINPLTNTNKETILIDKLKYITGITLDTGTWITPQDATDENEKVWQPNNNAQGLLTIQFNDGIKSWYIPAVNGIDFNESTGELSYSVFQPDKDKDYSLTHIKYIKKIIQTETSGHIFIIYNTVRADQEIDLTELKLPQEERSDIIEQIGTNEFEIFPIKTISRIYLDGNQIKAQYTTGDPETVVQNFIDITDVEYNEAEGVLTIQKNGVSTPYDLYFPKNISYNKNTSNLQYTINKTGQKKVVGTLPLIHDIGLSSNKNFFIKMNQTGEGYITSANETFEDSNYPKEQGWVYLGNLGQPLQIMKPATKFTFENLRQKLRSLLSSNDPLLVPFEDYTIYTKNKNSAVVNALNYLYPDGTLKGEDLNFENSGYAELGLVTVGNAEGNDLIDFFGYDYNRTRTVTTNTTVVEEDGETIAETTVVYGTWYYLGQIKVGEVNIGDTWGNNDNILLKKQKIYDITTFALNHSNPMEHIKGGKDYTTLVTDSNVTSSSQLYISMGNQELTNVYDESTKRIFIEGVSGDIVLRKIIN